MPVIDMIATGNNIKKMCIANGLSVKDIQNACGFTTGNAVYKWISGKCMPTIDNMVIIADMFNTTIDNIIVVSRQ